MAITKRIVCLANSRKLQGRCIAGRELVGGIAAGWIRPISDREHEEVSEAERQYEDGSDPKVLDIIDVPVVEPRPTGYQRENWLIEPNEYWVKVGRFHWSALITLTEQGGALWLDGHSTYSGRNDCIPLEQAATLESSLRFIQVESMQLSVFRPGAGFGNPKRRVQAEFSFGGSQYALWVTDPVIERAYLALPDSDHALGGSYLTISLGEPFEGRCYKLVAAVIQKTQVQ